MYFWIEAHDGEIIRVLAKLHLRHLAILQTAPDHPQLLPSVSIPNFDSLALQGDRGEEPAIVIQGELCNGLGVTSNLLLLSFLVEDLDEGTHTAGLRETSQNKRVCRAV